MSNCKVEGTGRKIFLQTKEECQKDIELDQSGQNKKQMQIPVLERKKRNFLFIIFLCRKP